MSRTASNTKGPEETPALFVLTSSTDKMAAGFHGRRWSARAPGSTATIVQTLRKLIKVEAMDTRRVLRFKLRNLGCREVDLEGLISRIHGLAALKDDRVFAKAKVIDWGAAVGWPGDIGIAAETLLRVADEQQR